MRLLFLAQGLLLGSVSLLAGCSSPAPIRYQGIASAVYLQPNLHMHHGHLPFTYRPDVDWSHYHHFIMEPVRVYQGSDAQFGKNISAKDKASLADALQEQFVLQLAQRFAQTLMSSDDALRVQITLTGARRTTPFIGTFTKFDVGGTPINLLQSIRGREGLFNGSVSYAVEIYAADSHQLLLSYVDKQYPNAMNIKASLGPLTAARAGARKAAAGLMDDLQ
ncbi:DUF3313 domain-containing protein [Frateuria aurantia]|uniref:DUF3313 domain-containing protein n=1 Tax=Frateuria aurantia (strain ATCC 33424 / DSM 6220 / KCTC 2777 / LMG 1558 / NBRC 3245 / NCIMB 13370) TaxID=767434 RepID=H8L4Y6_FRAAD|nr:DUF3313 domain-containing protein [Frateuria aurantia]AFC85700.1 Protein of unknown function (DUF3313) [Frateuria aurantia DSM 6220]